VAPRRLAAVLSLALAAVLVAPWPPAAAGPMLSGGDTRDLAATPLVVFAGPVNVHPGENGSVTFTLTNRYNQSMDAVRIDAAFKIGGSWLEARRLEANATDVPAFSHAMPTPFAVIAHQNQTVALPFTTPGNTQAGVFLVSLTLAFQYVNSTGQRVDARFASLGSIDAPNRTKVDLGNYTATLDALALDGIVPDSSITVDSGEALALWLTAAAFGAAVVVVGVAYGTLAQRRAKGRRKAP
jgi:hypothetical protein